MEEKNMHSETENKNEKKYIDSEEVLYSYECMTNWIIIRFVVSILALYVIYKEGFVYREVELKTIFLFIFILGIALLWFFIDIKTLINKGIYITEQHIITFSKKKYPLESIYYRWAGGGVEMGSVALRLYYEKKLIISCLVKDDENYNQMISVLENLSNNKNLRNISLRDGKRKLIQKEGQDNG